MSASFAAGVTEVICLMPSLPVTAQTCDDISSLSETCLSRTAVPSVASGFRTSRATAVAGVAAPGSVGLAPVRALLTTNCMTCPW